MNLTPVSARWTAALALLIGWGAPLSAQNLLLTEYNGKFLPVVRAWQGRPYVEVDGKEVLLAAGRRYALHKVPEYLPYFVSVRDMDANTQYLDVQGSALNNDFFFHARLETPFSLDHVFLVLELDTESAGKVIFLQEVGDLEARVPKQISVGVPMSAPLGSGHYQLHLFSRGMEVLHSEIPSGLRDAVLDQMTRKRIAGVQDAPPKQFVGPVPEYPAALLKSKTKGSAVISLRIGTHGQVYDPKVKSATDPAFGESALVAVRLWRFLPRMIAGRPVDTVVELPFDFTPPEKAEKKS